MYNVDGRELKIVPTLLLMYVTQKINDLSFCFNESSRRHDSSEEKHPSTNLLVGNEDVVIMMTSIVLIPSYY